MIRVYEFSTWKNSEEARLANNAAVSAAKEFFGKKYTVAIGEWGTRTFLVLGANDKNEARSAALEKFRENPSGGWHEERIKVRDVTNAKKYN